MQLDDSTDPLAFDYHPLMLSRCLALLLSLSLSLSTACGGPSGSSDASDGGSGDVGDSDTGDSDTGDASVPECEALIDCITIVSPEAISSTTAAYGPEGSCFDIPGVTPEDCAAECDALRADLAEINPDVAECAPLDCNDGVLNLEELCDSTSGCSATCTFTLSNLVCNPLNQTGCENDNWPLCWMLFAGDPGFNCYNGFVSNPQSNVGDTCGNPDGTCADLSMCLNHPACGGSPCCVEVCYSGPTEDDFGACAGGIECVPVSEVFGGPTFEGSELYGLCMPG
jgi:hypothetical protein